MFIIKQKIQLLLLRILLTQIFFTQTLAFHDACDKKVSNHLIDEYNNQKNDSLEEVNGQPVRNINDYINAEKFSREKNYQSNLFSNKRYFENENNSITYNNNNRNHILYGYDCTNQYYTNITTISTSDVKQC